MPRPPYVSYLLKRLRPQGSVYAQVAADITEAEQIARKGKRNEFMRNKGLYKLRYTLHATVFPHFDGMTMCPQDVMHAEFSSGICNQELAALLYVLIKKGEVTVERLNIAIELYTWPTGTKPPALHASVASGTRESKPHPDCHLRLSGSQTLHFAQHSVALLGPLVKNRLEPAWQSWLAHMSYLELLLRTSFSRADVLELDRRIFVHQRLFFAVPQYADLPKPKHHFATHFANDLLMNGPPRYGWCFGYAPTLHTFLWQAYCFAHIDLTLCTIADAAFCMATPSRHALNQLLVT